MKWEARFYHRVYFDADTKEMHVPIQFARRFASKVLIEAIEKWLDGGVSFVESAES